MKDTLRNLTTLKLYGALMLSLATTMIAPAAFANDDAAQAEQPEASVVGERHRHGPPGKGRYHTQRHDQAPDCASGDKRPKRYGPPSKRFRSWCRAEASVGEIRERTATEAVRKHRGPPGKNPRSRH